jgi:hypothetical protein
MNISNNIFWPDFGKREYHPLWSRVILEQWVTMSKNRLGYAHPDQRARYESDIIWYHDHPQDEGNKAKGKL